MVHDLTIDAAGRLVIPKPLRKRLNLGPGARLHAYEEDGRLVRIRDGRWFHAEAIAELIRKLRRFAQTSRRIDVAAFKDLAGVTRKNAIPLLEHLDAERVTRRVGNEREILGA